MRRARLAKIAAAAFSLAGVAALAAARFVGRGSGGASSSWRGLAERPLPPRRVAALAAVAEVVPSQYPDARFQQLAPTYKPQDPAWREMLTRAGVNPDAYTTCGELPRYVGERLSPPVHTKGGLSSIRDLGLTNGAWVVADGKKRPRPGDFYLLSKDGPGKTIVHTGVIVDATGDSWRTADAGQGTHANQAALYNERRYDAANITLGGPSGPHFLVGWYDLDKDGLILA